MLKTTDGGRTWSWQSTLPDCPRHIQALSTRVAYMTTYVPDDFPIEEYTLGPVYKTVDGGRHWKTLSSAQGAGLFFATPTVGWVVGGLAYTIAEWMYKTVNGATWRDRSARDQPQIHDMQLVGTSFGCAVGGERGRNGGIQIYNGATWSAVDPGFSLPSILMDVDFCNATSGWVVGVEPAVVLHTVDGGRNWTKQ